MCCNSILFIYDIRGLYMAKLTRKKQSQTHRVIVYGASFSGKSLLVGKLAEHYNLIWIDMEQGHGVLHQLPEEWKEKIDIIELPDTRSYPIAIETVLKLVKGKVSICEEHGKCGCMVCKKEDKEFTEVDFNNLPEDTIIVFDTLSQLTSSAIANITKHQPDDYKLQFDDWGHLGGLLDIVLSHIQQASCNVICISHVNEVQTPDKKTALTPTGGTKNFSSNITKYFTDVVYLERKNKKHTCISSTTAATNIIAGSQTNIDLAALGEPSLLPIFKPELSPSDSPIQTKSSPSATGGKEASNILARLKNK